MNRRSFMKGSLLAAGGVLAGCSTTLTSTKAAPRFRKPGEKLNIGAIGVDGKGWSDWGPMFENGENIVALCDIDKKAIEKGLARLREKGLDKGVQVFTDYRKMLETCKNLDAVTVSTPDHIHAPAAIEAMRLGCHVYVQKPLVRTIGDARLFQKTAREMGVVTQMGNQGSARHGFRRGVEILRSGVLGDMTEVHVWTNRPEIEPGCEWGWKQPLDRPQGADPIPDYLDWDSWIGPAPKRDFKAGVYHRILWRAFYDFGTGAFGDMGCHTMNLPFRGLELGTVLKGEALEISEHYDDTYPLFSKVCLTYAARGNKPEVKLFWYDGYRKPHPDIMPQVVAAFGAVPTTGCLIVGSKGILVSTNDYGEESYIALKGEEKIQSTTKHPACTEALIPKTLPRAKNQDHYLEFVNACKGEGKTFSDIDFSIPLVESMCVGCLAQRVSGKVVWDAKRCKSDNKEANRFIQPFMRKGWEY